MNTPLPSPRLPRPAGARPEGASGDLPRATGAPRGGAITYGTFDLFHVGHVRLFQRIRERWGSLIVAVSTDEFNALKGKRAAVPFEDRLEIVRACRHVDHAIAEHDWAQKERDIRRFGCRAFVMGDDWIGKFDHLRGLCTVEYLPRTTGISSTQLRGPRAPLEEAA